jgi:ElaB/YqjD/DUF883 family membrane-anchored ribosome-binding protein
MNTDALTTPSPELKQHAQDLKDHATEGAQNLKKDVTNVAHDLKDHANRGVKAVKEEANNQFQGAQEKASDLWEAVQAFAKEHPGRTFGAGVLAGLFLGFRFRR